MTNHNMLHAVKSVSKDRKKDKRIQTLEEIKNQLEMRAVSDLMYRLGALAKENGGPQTCTVDQQYRNDMETVEERAKDELARQMLEAL